MTIRTRIATVAVAAGALGVAAPIATANADTISASANVPALATTIQGELNAGQNAYQAGLQAALGGWQAGAQAAQAGWQAGLTAAQGGWQAGTTAAQAGFSAGATALGMP